MQKVIGVVARLILGASKAEPVNKRVALHRFDFLNSDSRMGLEPEFSKAGSYAQ